MSQADMVDSALVETRDLLLEAVTEVEQETPRVQKVKEILARLMVALNELEVEIR